MSYVGFVTKLLVVAFTVTGCTRSCSPTRESLSPEKVVEGYLNTVFNMKSVAERDVLLQYTTGRLKDAIASASDEVIEKGYVKRYFNLESYAVIERRDRTPREVEITYRLKFQDLGPAETRPVNPNAPRVQTENTVALIREKGSWYIRDQIGAKTSVEFLQEEVITAKPGVVSPDPAPQE